jgi:hypothetical protein
MHQHSDLFVRCIYLSLQNARVQLGMLKLSLFLQQLWYIAQQFFHGSQKLRLHFTPTGNFVSLCSINRFGFISQFGDSFGYHKADHWFIVKTRETILAFTTFCAMSFILLGSQLLHFLSENSCTVPVQCFF